MDNLSLSSRDLDCIWHPCSQQSQYLGFGALPLIPIKSASGIYLYDFDGNRYIDCISSWWVNLFGHCNPYINNKLIEQLNSLEHTLLAGFTHEPIVRLSERLLSLASCEANCPQLSKCFYADNGSSAVEVALKMSFHKHILDNSDAYNKAVRSSFLRLEGSYHGETIGALSMCGIEMYGKVYEPILLESHSIPAPSGECYDASLSGLKSVLDLYGDSICAFILEPVLQCAVGMNIYSPNFVKLACDMVRRYGIHVVFDEIATGFGRTGCMFAMHECGVVPDFLCLSKGLSGGYLPISVVLTTEDVYSSFLGDRERAFLHSHSYTGNALACACANATLDIFEEYSILDRNRELSKYIASLWYGLVEFRVAKNFRHKGMVFAFDLDGVTGTDVFKVALSKGIILRPLGNTIYFMPPYIITEEQATHVVSSIRDTLSYLTNNKLS